MNTIIRRPTRQIRLGKLAIGGDAPISIQSMLCVPTANVEAAARQIAQLEKASCEIIRFSVMNQADASAIPALKRMAAVPLVADIHFDHKLALAALEAGIDGLRINPGNIGSRERLRKWCAWRRNAGFPSASGSTAVPCPKNWSPNTA